MSGGELPFHVLQESDYPLHSRARTWVVFSDLHCSTQTVDVCRTVLRTVHETALQHDAGIIFLGDFWHLRGKSAATKRRKHTHPCTYHHSIS